MAEKDGSEKRLPRVNFRPLVFCAAGLCCGLVLYTQIAFGALTAADLLLFAAVIFLALLSFSPKRILCFVLCFLVFAGAGAALMHLCTLRFSDGAKEGEYEVRGVVSEFWEYGNYSRASLTDLSLDGEPVQGAMTVSLSGGEVRNGDEIVFSARVGRNELPSAGDSSYAFSHDLRYRASASSFRKTGETRDPFLRLNASVYDLFHPGMGEEGEVCYALLTGNSAGVDEGLMQAVREGGIAHIFAVSGLHIGIFYGAALFLFRFLRRYACLPALALAVCYCAFCGFPVSAVRALVMCGAAALNRLAGRKTDFPETIAFAAVAILLFSPAQWLDVGFRLSFGAVLGLALLSGPLFRAFRRIRLPQIVARGLASSVSVQILLVPICLESFGYVSLWGVLLNVVLIPLLPALFLILLLCTLLSLLIPPAAFVFLALPGSAMSLLLLLFSCVDFAVIEGISLGAGGAALVAGAVLLSERVRMGKLLRALTAAAMAAIVVGCALFENAVFFGCKIAVFEDGEAEAALIRTNGCAVLILDGDMSLRDCERFLSRACPCALDAAVVLTEDGPAVNVAAFTGAKTLYLRRDVETGLKNVQVCVGDAFEIGGLRFRFETDEKLLLSAENVAVEIDFENAAALGADLFVQKGSGGLKFFLHDGIIKTL